jgi:replicative DNA helicase
LADSLGFKTSIKEKMARIKSINYETKVYRVYLVGDLRDLPCKVERKKPILDNWNSRQRKDYKMTTIKIVPDSKDYYYGFEIDQDHLFLLEDMTVTHNSAYALCMMKNLAAQKIYTAQLVLEMNKISFLDRYTSARTGIPITSLVKNRYLLNATERAILDSELQALLNNPYLYLCDTPSPRMADIKRMIKELQKKLGQTYLVVVIDLFDKIKDILTSADNLTPRFHISLNEIQILAKELGVHFVLVAQINREPEKAKSKRPGLFQLKHSGAYEEIADIVFLLDRPSYREFEHADFDVDSTSYSMSFDYDSVSKFFKESKAKDSGADAMYDVIDVDTELKKSKDFRSKFDAKLESEKLIRVGDLVIPRDEYAEVILAKQRGGIGNKIIPFDCSLFTSVQLISPVKESF